MIRCIDCALSKHYAVKAMVLLAKECRSVGYWRLALKVWVELSNTYPHLELEDAYPGNLAQDYMQQQRLRNKVKRHENRNAPLTVRLKRLKSPNNLQDFAAHESTVNMDLDANMTQLSMFKIVHCFTVDVGSR